MHASLIPPSSGLGLQHANSIPPSRLHAPTNHSLHLRLCCNPPFPVTLEVMDASIESPFDNSRGVWNLKMPRAAHLKLTNSRTSMLNTTEQTPQTTEHQAPRVSPPHKHSIEYSSKQNKARLQSIHHSAHPSSQPAAPPPCMHNATRSLQPAASKKANCKALTCPVRGDTHARQGDRLRQGKKAAKK